MATVDFSYDALGRRYQLTTAVTNTTYQYDGLNIAETWFDGLTGQASTYLSGLGLDELFSFTFWNGVTNTNDSVLRDPLNSAVAVTDSSQALQDQYTYDPYGNTSDSGGSSANPFQFTGRENDGNGLYYMRARYYAPAIGRFISRDPSGFAGGFNLYEYAGDSPTNFTDPTGLQADVPVIGWPPGQNYPTPNPTGPPGTNGWYGIGQGPGGVGLEPLANVANQNGLDIFYVAQNAGGIASPEQVLFKRFFGRATVYNCCNPTTSTGDPFSPNRISSAAMPRNIVPRRDSRSSLSSGILTVRAVNR